MKKLIFAGMLAAILGWGDQAAAFTYEACANSQMTFGVNGTLPSPADDCFDWTSEYGNPDVEKGMVDAAFGNIPDNEWAYISKFESSDVVGTYNGIEFTLSAQNDSEGEWAISWNDTTGEALPATLDFAFVIKAAQGTGGFLFDDMELPASPTNGGGVFEVGVLNNNGRALGLSHLTMFVRDGAGGGGGGGGGGGEPSVPLPGTLVLMAVALFGLRWRMVEAA